jgi:putative N-acetyltransferase (TIGR04045 family)
MVSSSAVVSTLTCRLVEAADELAAHHAVRHRVFVLDQRLFAGTDRDERDQRPETLHVVGVERDEIDGVDIDAPVGADPGVVVGAVRLYPLDTEGLWQGDRLAVLPEARVRHLGALLVRFAVATAGHHGGHTMVAQIQSPNVRFFEHLGWHADGPAGPYHGVMHQPMAIPLAPAWNSLDPNP